MSALSALLARDGVVPLPKIDEAIQRQVMDGGDFETNLLEIGAIADDTLAAYCAAMHGLAPARRDELAEVAKDLIARVPRTLAETHSAVPIRVEGGRLVLAMVAPPDAAAANALSVAIGMPIEVRITSSFRVAWALAKHYGAPLSPRLARLASRLDKKPSGLMPAVGTTSAGGRGASPSAPPSPALAYSGRVPASALAALTAVLEDDRVSLMPDAPVVAIPAPSRAAPVLSVDATRQRIALADSRTAIVDVLAGFAEERFSYSAFFVIHGDVAEGLSSRGAGVSTEVVRGIAVPLDAPGSFHDVRSKGEPLIGPLGRGATDPMVKEDLGRKDASDVALLPIHIGGRVAMVLWCDAGKNKLDLKFVDEVVTLTVEAAKSFERIIVEKKRKQAAASPPAARAPEPQSVTRGDIAQKVAGQRGAQLLRSLAAHETGRPATVPDAAPEVPAAAARSAAIAPAASNMGAPTTRGDGVFHAPRPEVTERLTREHTREPRTVAADEPTRDTMPDPSPPKPRASDRPPSATAFARGGRVPISVDVIGPLPETLAPASTHSVRARSRADSRPPPPSDGSPRDPTELVAEIVRSRAMSDSIANVLLGGGDRALDAVFRFFPGPVTVDRLDTRVRLPPVSDMGPILRLVVMFRSASAQHLVERLESSDAEQRYFATLCLGEVIHAPAIPRLLSRLFDSDFPTRVAAVEVLRTYRKFSEFDSVVRTLRTILSDASAPTDRRRAAANALGELRDTAAVPALIACLSDSDAALSSVAQRALVVLARQDFGTAGAKWYGWWESSQHAHRVEWLIEALMHTDATLRHEASEELKKLTGQFFGYYFNLPRRERDRAQQRYREWWASEGRARFTG